ncbi:hypothetical protein B484DRAFT_401768 [Ochromonadaceae sp. CCMP2298]|nr:hypothetical protein B484DRAFT_401768 [Ochromonadaceae sp. CCMP2298]
MDRNRCGRFLKLTQLGLVKKILDKYPVKAGKHCRSPTGDDIFDEKEEPGEPISLRYYQGLEVLHEGGQSGHTMISEQSKFKRSKHILTKIMHIRDLVTTGCIVAKHIVTDQMTPDVLTKPKQGETFELHRKNMMGEMWEHKMHWDVEYLLSVLSEESQSLLQKMGIEQLKSIEFNQEIARRAKAQPYKQESPYPRNPSAASAEGDAQGKQGGAGIVKGSDGMLHSDIKCYKCNNNGHYAKHCPTKKSPVANSSEMPVAEPVEALKGASANTTTGPYSTVGAKGELTNAAFTVEIDDNWDEESSANPAYLTDVETLELMDRGKGPGPR